MNKHKNMLQKKHEEAKQAYATALFLRDKVMSTFIKSQQNLELIQQKLNDIAYELSRQK